MRCVERVAVHRAAGGAERDGGVQQLADQRLQPLGEVGAPAMDADERNRAGRVLLDDLMSDSHERAAHVVAVEGDLCGFQLLLLSGLTGPSVKGAGVAVGDTSSGSGVREAAVPAS